MSQVPETGNNGEDVLKSTNEIHQSILEAEAEPTQWYRGHWAPIQVVLDRNVTVL